MRLDTLIEDRLKALRVEQGAGYPRRLAGGGRTSAGTPNQRPS